MDGGTELTCVRHGKPTRITCVTCDTPICPDCAIRTPVGLKCPDHATKPAPPRRGRAGVIAVALVVLGLVGFAQLARTTGRGEPSKPPCPTETAPDVGIGPAGGGGHWTELAGSGLCGRYDSAVAWTGTELLVWGGENCAGAACPTYSAPHLADGGGYRPATNAWRKLAKSPLSARTPAVTVWTGTEMVVWGGVSADAFSADGAAYDPAKDRWRMVAAAPSLAARSASMAVWTGKEMVVWGGADTDRSYADGAAYDPAADRWRRLADAPIPARAGAVVAWTGREMLVWGGGDRDRGYADGAAYDPAADRWRPLAASPLAGRDDPATVWTGRELVVWSGNALDGATLLSDGAAYDPATDRWRGLPPAPVAPRTGAATVWSGREMLVWGGIGPVNFGGSGPLDRVLERRSNLTPAEDGAAYDPATNRWRTLERVAFLGRGFPIAAWDGTGMLVWGGLVVVSSPASAADGVRYTP